MSNLEEKRIQLFIQRGIRRRPTPNGTIFINNETVGSVSDWAGSFHILSMGRHHRSYTSATFPRLHSRVDLPHLDYYQKLNCKNSSQQVIGNFGECIGAIFARRKLGASINNIVPLTTNRTFKRPDYMMYLEGSNIRKLFAEEIPPNIPFPHLEYLNWWPVESKAVASQNDFTQKKRALIQLLSFWKKERENLQLSIGYGMILTYFYREPAKILASLILPKEPEELYDYLGEIPNEGKNGLLEHYQTAARYIYDCNI